MPLLPVERQTLAKTVMERLILFIRSDGIEAGDALPSQHELARQLSVSRPILREALQGLATAGIISIRPGSGCYVRDPNADVNPETLLESYTHEAALEVLEARMVVEVELAGLAAERASAADLDRMAEILRRLKRGAARGQLSSPITSDFHQALSRSARNVVLHRMAQMLARPRLAQGMRVEDTLPDVTPHEYSSHRLLYEAVCSRDPGIARDAMRKHLEIAHGWECKIAELKREKRGRADDPGEVVST
jgi:GntR family transcriptional repressor for pyruvate dehydrogenase complex